MKIFLLVLLFVVIIGIPAASYSEQQEPIFESENLEELWGILGLDLQDSKEVRTENYIHLLNFNNNHVVVISLKAPYMFVGVNIYMAYYIVCPNDCEPEFWRMYQVERQDTDSPITQLFIEMEREWLDYIDKGCPRDKENLQELQQEGILM